MWFGFCFYKNYICKLVVLKIKKMEYRGDFKDLLEYTNESFIGYGNPNSGILIIGKETSDPDDSYGFMANNRTDWLRNVNSGYGFDDLKREADEEHKKFFNPLFPYYDLEMQFRLRRKALPSDSDVNDHATSRTWYVYQKLVDLIYNVPLRCRHDRLDFFEKVFITELSEVSAANSSIVDAEARRLSVMSRTGELFLKHPFFKHFQIVVMAVGTYIGRKDLSVVPQEIFNVCNPVEQKAGNDRIRIYRSGDGRVVVHTRQLSSYVSNNLLQAVACIAEHK